MRTDSVLRVNLLALLFFFFQLLSADTSEPPDETCSQTSAQSEAPWLLETLRQSLGNGRSEGVELLVVERRELS